MSLARDVTTVGSATLLSRLLGFLRDAGIAAVLGAGVLSDAFFAALQIPNLFRRLLAEGALNSAFVPMWIRIEQESGRQRVRRFAEEILGLLFAALSVIALLGIWFAPLIVRVLTPGFEIDGLRFALAAHYIQLSIPYVAVAGLVAVAASALNAQGRVGAAALGIVMFNCILVVAVLLVIASDTASSSVAGSILSGAIVAAGLGQLLLVGGALVRMPHPPIRPRFTRSADTRRFFARVIPGVIAGGIPQLKLMAGAMVASSSQAAVSWLYYANRLYELPLGVASIAVASVMGPAIAASIRRGDDELTAASQARAFEIALGLALPSAVAFAVLAAPIAGGLFQRGAFGPRDTAAVAGALAAISAGLPGHVLEKVFGAISFAHEDTRTPMFAALAGLATAITGAVLLFPTYGHVGVAAAIAISGWVGATILGTILWRRRWLAIDAAARRRLPLIVLTTAIMALALIGAREFLHVALDASGSALLRGGSLIALVVFGLAIYLAALQVLKVARFRDLVGLVRRRA